MRDGLSSVVNNNTIYSNTICIATDKLLGQKGVMMMMMMMMMKKKKKLKKNVNFDRSHHL